MKNSIKLLTFLFFISFFYSCDKNELDSNELSHNESTSSQLKKSNLNSPCNLMVYGPECGNPGDTLTYYFNVSNANWIINPDPGIIVISQTADSVTLFLNDGSSNGSIFNGNSFLVSDGSLDCKASTQIDLCDDNNDNDNNDNTCSIKGPNCGIPGETLSFSFSGANQGQNIIWTSNSPEVVLISGQGTSIGVFELSNNFTEGIINASLEGFESCSVNFPIIDCCQQNIITIGNTNRILIH